MRQRPPTANRQRIKLSPSTWQFPSMASSSRQRPLSWGSAVSAASIRKSSVPWAGIRRLSQNRPYGTHPLFPNLCCNRSMKIGLMLSGRSRRVQPGIIGFRMRSPSPNSDPPFLALTPPSILFILSNSCVLTAGIWHQAVQSLGNTEPNAENPQIRHHLICQGPVYSEQI